ncbi:MAG: hypothetical protein COB50_04685 [Thiotrichales bacterium]|nr:MAG: hypothetical protein COB50_04685 [Thiotrichales bacterium]
MNLYEKEDSEAGTIYCFYGKSAVEVGVYNQRKSEVTLLQQKTIYFDQNSDPLDGYKSIGEFTLHTRDGKAYIYSDTYIGKVSNKGACISDAISCSVRNNFVVPYVHGSIKLKSIGKKNLQYLLVILSGIALSRVSEFSPQYYNEITQFIAGTKISAVSLPYINALCMSIMFAWAMFGLWKMASDVQEVCSKTKSQDKKLNIAVLTASLLVALAVSMLAVSGLGPLMTLVVGAIAYLPASILFRDLSKSVMKNGKGVKLRIANLGVKALFSVAVSAIIFAIMGAVAFSVLAGMLAFMASGPVCAQYKNYKHVESKPTHYKNIRTTDVDETDNTAYSDSDDEGVYD